MTKSSLHLGLWVLFGAVVLLLSRAPAQKAGPSVATDPLAFSREASPLVVRYVAPTRILWQEEGLVENAATLLKAEVSQATLPRVNPPVVLRGKGGKSGGVLLDFGRELAGGIELFTPIQKDKRPVKVRVRFGESAAEAMAEIGGKGGAGNDHAMRDLVVELPWLGRKRIGDSGFRFVRIDLAEEGREVHLSGVRAYLRIRDVPYLGSFQCSDPLLNEIWSTGAYTVHLNMQDYLWDGVKRDRLVWVGDMHPEVRAITTVFGHNPVVEDSLDLSRDVTPLPEWMSGISSYSMWWILIHEEWYRTFGDRDYLQAQREYLLALLAQLAKSVDGSGKETLNGHRFLDWPTAGNEPSIHAGLQSLMIMSLEAGARLCQELEEEEAARNCRQAVRRLRKHVPDHGGVKQPAALMVLAGIASPEETSDRVLLADGARGLSTFYGFYVLEALARAGKYEEALDLIREYWGGMLSLGATTFWEHFDVAWQENAGRIDELPRAGQVDVHGTYGEHCYVGYRHSLCHGWAAGPTIWLSEHVLGVRVLAPGRVRLSENLGSLKWAKGTFPTKLGVLSVQHERQPDGTVKTTVTTPPGLEVVDAEGKPLTPERK